MKLARELAKRQTGTHPLPPRRAHHRPPLRRRPQAPRSPPPPRRPRQHRHRHRAQPRRHQRRLRSSTWAPKAAKAAAASSPTAPPNRSPPSPASHTGSFLARYYANHPDVTSPAATAPTTPAPSPRTIAAAPDAIKKPKAKFVAPEKKTGVAKASSTKPEEKTAKSEEDVHNKQDNQAKPLRRPRPKLNHEHAHDPPLSSDLTTHPPSPQAALNPALTIAPTDGEAISPSKLHPPPYAPHRRSSRPHPPPRPRRSSSSPSPDSSSCSSSSFLLGLAHRPSRGKADIHLPQASSSPPKPSATSPPSPSPGSSSRSSGSALSPTASRPTPTPPAATPSASSPSASSSSLCRPGHLLPRSPCPKSIPMDDFFRTPSDVWLVTAFGTLLAPLFEEILFRGFLLPAFAIAYDWLSLPRTPAARERWHSPTNSPRRASSSPPSSPASSSPSLHGQQTGLRLARPRPPLLRLAHPQRSPHPPPLRRWPPPSSTPATTLTIFLTAFIATGGYRHLERMTR